MAGGGGRERPVRCCSRWRLSPPGANRLVERPSPGQRGSRHIAADEDGTEREEGFPAKGHGSGGHHQSDDRQGSGADRQDHRRSADVPPRRPQPGSGRPPGGRDSGDGEHDEELDGRQPCGADDRDQHGEHGGQLTARAAATTSGRLWSKPGRTPVCSCARNPDEQDGPQCPAQHDDPRLPVPAANGSARACRSVGARTGHPPTRRNQAPAGRDVEPHQASCGDVRRPPARGAPGAAAAPWSGSFSPACRWGLRAGRRRRPGRQRPPPAEPGRRRCRHR